mmetsp:Transcript_5331/g.15889  ORF Transcript_5331/g.15889 Transcript_5331/m.15889 type:complete len:293 (+) Transcript_5331:239-1117(+)
MQYATIVLGVHLDGAADDRVGALGTYKGQKRRTRTTAATEANLRLSPATKRAHAKKRSGFAEIHRVLRGGAQRVLEYGALETYGTLKWQRQIRLHQDTIDVQDAHTGKATLTLIRNGLHERLCVVTAADKHAEVVTRHGREANGHLAIFKHLVGSHCDHERRHWKPFHDLPIPWNLVPVVASSTLISVPGSNKIGREAIREICLAGVIGVVGVTAALADCLLRHDQLPFWWPNVAPVSETLAINKLGSASPIKVHLNALNAGHRADGPLVKTNILTAWIAFDAVKLDLAAHL